MPNLVPVVIEKEARGERSYDIYSRLLKDRIIMLDTEVSQTSASLIVAQMLFLESQNKEKPIRFHINSPGGSVVGAESTYVALSQLSKQKPSASVLGETATSGGYLIAIATDKIISRSNTLTGSIGVILQYPNLSKLLKKIGIDVNTLRSSDLKASLNLFERPTSYALEIGRAHV